MGTRAVSLQILRYTLQQRVGTQTKIKFMSKYSAEELLQIDKQHIWHPYSTTVNPPEVFPVVSASGVRLKLADGSELIDGMSSWWAAIHGYNHPILNAAAHQQINTMSHVMFGGLTHPKAVELAQLLVNITPAPLDKVFFCDSGSVATEVAIKMAMQYWYSQNQPKKNRLLTIRSGYHGDTFGAMAVCDPVTGMHEIFTAVLPKHFFAPSPSCGFAEPCLEQDITDFQQLMVRYHDELAAVILEPIVQGAGGMKFYSPDYLKQVRELCDHYDVLLICDEIATGFGRSGKLFACEHAGIAPDIMCIGKALTGGYMTLAATLCTSKVSDGICRGTIHQGTGHQETIHQKTAGGAFMHGPTFMANPLACAVAVASIKLLLSTHWQRQVLALEKSLKEQLEPCRQLAIVKDVRVLGAIGVVELKQNVDMYTLPREFVKRGVWVRPFGKLVYVMPPYIISPADLATLTTALFDVVANIRH